jgi:CBS domain-containing protein
MRAYDLAEQYPIVTMDTPAVVAARRLAAERLSGVVVVDEKGRPACVLPATQVLRLGVPRYTRDDPTLARVIDEAHADVFLRELGDRTMAECLPKKSDQPPTVDEDATVLEIAALMVRHRSPLIPVVNSTGVMIGVITVPRLLDRVLSQ